ncbi:MAG: hypothetical protein LBT62_05190, partial [Deltaproteobacteria bacterium]|nr:hypothetical protein [Deltaproteobacteria bacterium]
IEALKAQISAGLQIFIVAAKNCGLYPKNSAIRKESLDKLFHWLSSFLEEFELLRLFVDPDCLLFQGHIVHQEKAGDVSLIFPFFRDGVQWIEFQENLTYDELEHFITLLNRFRMLREDDEDDLVTSMWAADFQGIKYKTANEFWDIDPITEIAALSAGPGQEPTTTQESEATPSGLATKDSRRGPSGISVLFSLIANLQTPHEPKTTDPNSPAGRSGSGGKQGSGNGSGGGGGGVSRHDEDLQTFKQMELNEDDWSALAGLVNKERKPLKLFDNLQPALDLLWRLRTLAQCNQILNFLADGVKFGFAGGSFRQILSLIERIFALTNAAAPRLAGVAEEFCLRISNREILEGLTSFNRPATLSPQRETALSHCLTKILSYLPPQNVRDMIWAAKESADEWVSGHLVRTIAALPVANAPELASYINATLKVPQILELIQLLKQSDHGQELLNGLSRHLDPKVRQAAGLALLTINPDLIASMTHLLNEPDPSLNHQIYYSLGLKRSKIVEKTLLTFLRQTYQDNIPRNENTLTNSYRALGLSATSAASVDFASEVLTQKNFRAFFGLGLDQDLAHRSGAAIALILMGHGDFVSKASHSLFKDIRLAARNAEMKAVQIKRPSN